MPTATKKPKTQPKRQTTNASLKVYKEPRNKTGKGGFGDRPQDRNTTGQRNREAVETAVQARALYVKVLHEPINTKPDKEMTNMELIVRQHVSAARKGDAQQREQMLDRIWGKSIQGVDLTNSDGSLAPQGVMIIPFIPDDSKDSNTS